MKNERIYYLLLQYIESRISEAEFYELTELFLEEQGNEDAMREAFEEIIMQTPGADTYSEADWDHIYKKIIAKPVVRIASERITQRRWFRWAAAVLVILVGSGTWFFFHAQKNSTAIARVSKFGGDVKAPQQHKAILTLANGKQITLDSTGIGSVAKEGGIGINKVAEGQIAYTGNGETPGKNTLIVPVGSRPMTIQLIDGTRVWLDAGSSLTYPIAFSGSDRSVEMTGQAYFEVAKNPAKKFYVRVGGITTEVLGTHFNVNAHQDEGDISVTLLEGSVNVRFSSPDRASSEVRLKPGQQTQLKANSRLKTTSGVDMEKVMAWKNGLFYFDRTNIRVIMRQVARWYDADIVYQGDVEQMDFSGTVPSKENISEVLKMLEMTGAIHFRVEGRTVYVTK
ncbi:MAG: DUF4974 domain-containing protein [Bacteroidota bacterium]|nr:DUF4974 domain-containing protein [Bacteroidota bacterium]MDP4212698.1 DUF4974 domain-containing protein [Bacteroidota bacterium]MDP4250124.1 DUF4974 domain-containing protein [Bacteroidota bacterium]